jgi:hypothetical protein
MKKEFCYKDCEITHFYKCSFCQKNSYNSLTEADRVRISQNKNLRIYKCPHNNGYHLTSHLHSGNEEIFIKKYLVK